MAACTYLLVLNLIYPILQNTMPDDESFIQINDMQYDTEIHFLKY